MNRLPYSWYGLTEMDVFKVLKQEKTLHPDYTDEQLVARHQERAIAVGFVGVPDEWVHRILVSRTKEGLL